MLLETLASTVVTMIAIAIIHCGKVGFYYPIAGHLLCGLLIMTALLFMQMWREEGGALWLISLFAAVALALYYFFAFSKDAERLEVTHE